MHCNLLPFIKLSTIGFLILLCQNLSAQESLNNKSNPIDKEGKHSVFVEVAGRTLIIGSLNYEYAIHKRFSLGVGLGFISRQSEDIARFNNGSQEIGRNTDTATSQFIYGKYFIGKKRHKLFFTGGLTHFFGIEKNKYPSGKEVIYHPELEWSAGLGYQFSTKKLNFRLTGYCLSLPGNSDIIPWGGISVGFKI